MADKNVGGAGFWQDWSKKTGTWAGTAALAVSVAELAENWVDAWAADPGPGWHHVIGVLAAAVVRAIVGLVQGKVGDASKASWTAGPTVDVPASDLRDTGDPDD